MNCSIVIPCFNAAATIAETLRSVAACDRIEEIARVYVVDDCSSDDSTEIARKSWSCTVPLTVYRFEKNRGQWPATNFAIEELAAGSEWTFLLHADDVVKPEWLSLYLDVIRNIPGDAVSLCSSYDVWFPDSGIIKNGENIVGHPPKEIRGERKSVRGTLKDGCWWHISGCAIRNEAFRKVGSFDPALPMLGDWDWLLRALSSGHSVWYIPRTTMLYRQIPTSVSGRSFRVAQDMEDRRSILYKYFAQQVLSLAELRAHQRSVLRLLVRRLLIRALRRDMEGCKAHFRLISSLGMEYLRREPQPLPA